MCLSVPADILAPVRTVKPKNDLELQEIAFLGVTKVLLCFEPLCDGIFCMMTIVKGASLSLLLSALFVTSAWAQGSYTAASCNQSAVNAVINGPTHTAVNGDVIVIPAGTCTWTSGISISGIGITIMGQGTPNTGASAYGAGTSNTALTQDTNSPLFYATGVPYGQTMRYSLLNLQPYSGLTTEAPPIVTDGSCSSSGCPNVRVDNITFSANYDNDPADAATEASDMWGVYDHNTVSGLGTSNPGTALVQIGNGSWLGVGSYGDNSFASPDTFGTNEALYVENNLLTLARSIENDVADDLGGDREVVRFNVWNSTGGSGVVATHSTAWTGRPRGTRQRETYGNVLNCTGSGTCGGGNFWSGAAYFFLNQFNVTGSGWFNYFAQIDVPSVWHSTSPWGYCGGGGAYDQNTGTVYSSGTVTTGGNSTFSDSSKSGTWTTNEWAPSGGAAYSVYDETQGFGNDILSNTTTQITVNGPYPNFNFAVGDSYEILQSTLCIDQPGRDQGTLLSGSTPSPTGWPNEVLDPVYEWGDTGNVLYSPPIYNPSVRLVANKDFYIEVSQSAQTSSTSPFNGTAGTGYGTLANRPSSCTQGVAYYATDQGSWNQSSINFPNQSFSQGEMFICTSTNTWTLSYTPYTYPHPLTATSVLPPSNLQASAH
jgi:hypothetical protein